jgi:two-component system response regulator (stage 0 sporulation protein A)
MSTISEMGIQKRKGVERREANFREPLNNDLKMKIMKDYMSDEEDTISIEKQSDNNLVKQKWDISEILSFCGIPRHIKGFEYLRSSILSFFDEEEFGRYEFSSISMTKDLYPMVAKKYQTTSSRVERAIRHAIEVAWDRGNIELLNKLFGYSIDPRRGKPTNAEFVALIVDMLRHEKREYV